MKKVSARKLCELYQQESQGNLDRELLFDVASRLDELCQSVPGFESGVDDHDWIKDAEKFHYAYQDACAGQVDFLHRGKTVEEYLMHELDVLMHGCHTDSSPADYYVEAGTALLDAIYQWNGTGNLYSYFQTFR